ncbi:MAG: L-threo-3-hydroxyaspartate ammonia-lyase, partial [uncultured Thermomicrobiales bacterium]
GRRLHAFPRGGTPYRPRCGPPDHRRRSADDDAGRTDLRCRPAPRVPRHPRHRRRDPGRDGFRLRAPPRRRRTQRRHRPRRRPGRQGRDRRPPHRRHPLRRQRRPGAVRGAVRGM